MYTFYNSCHFKEFFHPGSRALHVTLDTHLSDDFKGNARNIAVSDNLVSNDYVKPGSGGDRNHHKSYGYLRTPEFSRHLATLL